MSPRVILDTVKSPTMVAPNPGGGNIYTGPGGQVILTPDGRVITVIPSGSNSFAYHFLRRGKTIQQLQVVIGHRNIQQTIDFYGDIVSRDEQKSSPY